MQVKEEKGRTEDEMLGWHHQLNDMILSKFWEIVKDGEAWQATVHGIKRVGHNLVNEQRR